MSEWTDADFDDLADWLGAQVESHNVTDPSDEQTTWIEIQVEDLARALLASGVVKPARVVEEAVRARNSAMRQRDIEAAAKEANWKSLGEWSARAERAEADLSRLRSAVEALAGWLCAFDIVDMPVPDSVDVPDDYELGINDAGARLAALLTEGRDRAGEGAGS